MKNILTKLKKTLLSLIVLKTKLMIFFGVYINESNEYKVVLPYIESVYDEIVWVHEYTHLLFLDDESEIFPNIMESYFINMYVFDKKEIIKRTKEEIDSSVCKEHTLSKKIKLRIISK